MTRIATFFLITGFGIAALAQPKGDDESDAWPFVPVDDCLGLPGS